MDFGFSTKEKKILKFWEQNKIFEKSLEQRKKGPAFIFYEGPPTANGRPGIHHVLTRVFKDIICRFKTMEGFYVARKAGWDTHGLPVELQTEKETGIKSKKDIEKYGVGKFNQKCRESVWQYKKEWEDLTERIGYWLDIDNPYITYTTDYIETLFSIIKKFYQKKFLYEDKKVVPWCPRCQTSLSSHELSQGYKRVRENSIYVKFKIKNPQFKIKNDSYFLAWTTTPWTLSGNTALAVNLKIKYALVKTRILNSNSEFENEEYLIFAKERLDEIFKKNGYKIIKEFKGKDLLGLKYEPLYRIKDQKANSAKNYKVVSGDFVSTEEGTGIVHIAPAFGEDDFNVSKKNNLSALITVNENGEVKKDVIGEGKFVKNADPLIIADLKKRKLLFREKLYEHDYPFCWRCKTPLLYYLHPSWFIEVSRIRKELIANNKTINWIPSYLKYGRFGKFLEKARDWNFSRERYWGTPLPIWKCKKCEKVVVIGSRKDLKKQKFSSNRYFVIRHSLAENNINEMLSDNLQKYSLTDLGKTQAKKVARELKKKNIDLIFSSDILRCRETAKIVGKELGRKPQFSKELREIKFGVFNGRSHTEYKRFFYEKGEKFYHRKSIKERKFYKKPEGGETWQELKMRMYNFLKKIDKKYKSKNILIVSHQDPILCLSVANEGISGPKEYKKSKLSKQEKIPHGKYFEIKLNLLPYNEKGDLDFHRPYIDDIKFFCPLCGERMKRVKEVVDCWFDSGSMPFAAEVPFPADFICEAIDQTRGWFYTLLAVATLLGFNSPYKNVISVNHVLDKKGEKMSKSKGNIVDPWVVIEKYSVDALRWYFYTVNQPGDSKLFDEKDVKKTFNRFILTFWNSFIFYKTYAEKNKVQSLDFKNISIFDKWIISCLQGLIKSVKKALDNFDIVFAAREIENFVINDLSNWYIRRSRSRFQKPQSRKEFNQASLTLNFVLQKLCKLSAPFIPFISEEIYQFLGAGKSVHLEDFPESKKNFIDKKLEKEMQKIREIVGLGLAKRREVGIKARQPLAFLKIKDQKSKMRSELLNLIKEEINVKRIIFDNKIKEAVELNIEITPELKKEGILREIIRTLQGARKSGGLTKEDKIKVFFEFPENLARLMKQNKELIKKEIIAIDITERKKPPYLVERKIKIDGQEIWIGIKKVK